MRHLSTHMMLKFRSTICSLIQEDSPEWKSYILEENGSKVSKFYISYLICKISLIQPPIISSDYIFFAEPDYLDMSIKIMITPKNFAESTINFSLGTKGKMITGVNNEPTTTERYNDYDDYGYRSRNDYRSYGGPSRYGGSRDYYSRSVGTFNMTASLMVIKVVEPTGGPK